MHEEFIQTVTGRIAPEEMGITSTHEHLLWDASCYLSKDAELPGNEYLNAPVRMEDLGKIWFNLHKHLDNVVQHDEQAAEEEAMEFKYAGGKTIVDCTSIGLRRNPAAVRRIAQRTGLNILLGTGAYLEISQPDHIKQASLEALHELFLKELRIGMDDTDVKAGFIGEVGISERFTKGESRVLQGAARASRDTGAAIIIHQPGLEKRSMDILDIIEDQGADLSKVVLGHCDVFYNEPEYLCGALLRGANIAFDTFGLDMVLNYTIPFPRDWDRITAIRGLIERGFGKQIVLGQDICFKVQLKRYGGNGYSHLLRNIRTLCEHAGFYDTWMDQLFVKNPRRIFSRKEASSITRDSKTIE